MVEVFAIDGGWNFRLKSQQHRLENNMVQKHIVNRNFWLEKIL